MPLDPVGDPEAALGAVPATHHAAADDARHIPALDDVDVDLDVAEAFLQGTTNPHARALREVVGQLLEERVDLQGSTAAGLPDPGPDLGTTDLDAVFVLVLVLVAAVGSVGLVPENDHLVVQALVVAVTIMVASARDEAQAAPIVALEHADAGLGAPLQREVLQGEIDGALLTLPLLVLEQDLDAHLAGLVTGQILPCAEHLHLDLGRELLRGRQVDADLLPLGTGLAALTDRAPRAVAAALASERLELLGLAALLGLEPLEDLLRRLLLALDLLLGVGRDPGLVRVAGADHLDGLDDLGRRLDLGLLGQLGAGLQPQLDGVRHALAIAGPAAHLDQHLGAGLQLGELLEALGSGQADRPHVGDDVTRVDPGGLGRTALHEGRHLETLVRGLHVDPQVAALVGHGEVHEAQGRGHGPRSCAGGSGSVRTGEPLGRSIAAAERGEGEEEEGRRSHGEESRFGHGDQGPGWTREYAVHRPCWTDPRHLAGIPSAFYEPAPFGPGTLPALPAKTALGPSGPGLPPHRGDGGRVPVRAACQRGAAGRQSEPRVLAPRERGWSDVRC